MGKMMLAGLLLVAFVYAAWCLILRRRLPDPASATGVRRRLYFSVLLCAAAFGGCAISARQSTYGAPQQSADADAIMCYDTVAPEVISGSGLLDTLRILWCADNPDLQSFRLFLAENVRAGHIPEEGTRLVVRALEARIRKQGRQKAKAQPIAGAGELRVAAEHDIAQQLAVMKEQKNAGRLDAETVQKVEARLARELEMLRCIDELLVREYDDADMGESIRADLKRLKELHNADAVTPQPSAQTAARMILWLESVEPAQSAPK